MKWFLMIFCDIHRPEPNPASSERLYPTTDGDRCKGPHPNIRQNQGRKGGMTIEARGVKDMIST